MTPRDVSTRLLRGLAPVVVAMAVGCYDAPKPLCGFRCGPADECPEDYTCGPQRYCRLDGSPEDLVCPASEDGQPYSPRVVSQSPKMGGVIDPLDKVVVVFDVPVKNVSVTSFRVQASAAGPVPDAQVMYYLGSNSAELVVPNG